MVRPEEMVRALVRRHEARRRSEPEAGEVRALLARALTSAPAPRPGRAWLVGSLAWGGFGTGSDVDVVVEGLDARAAAAFAVHLTQALPVVVQVLRLEEISPTFAARVVAEGEALDVSR